MNTKLIITTELLPRPSDGTCVPCLVCALYEDNRMVDVTAEPAGRESILNNIYVARVQNVSRQLSAAFVEIAKGKKCYLPLKDIRNPVFTKKISPKPVVSGDELVVQIVKEAVKTKDPVVTTVLEFPGEYLVVTSDADKTGISSRVKGPQRQRLQKLSLELRKDCSPGIIMRTNAAAADDAQIVDEFMQLRTAFEQLVSQAAHSVCYSCLRKERPFYLKMLLDADKTKLDEVVTDQPHILEQIRNAVPHASYRLRLYEDPLLPLAKLYNVAGRITDALKQRVWLKSGANLIIQPVEALTVIDVNSGKNISKKETSGYHYQINLEAAAEIARQLRLRNISGIIIVDFIDMRPEELNISLLDAFREFLRQDPVPVRLEGMTKLGLVELTRKKQKKSLAEQLNA